MEMGDKLHPMIQLLEEYQSLASFWRKFDLLFFKTLLQLYIH